MENISNRRAVRARVQKKIWKCFCTKVHQIYRTKRPGGRYATWPAQYRRPEAWFSREIPHIAISAYRWDHFVKESLYNQSKTGPKSWKSRFWELEKYEKYIDFQIFEKHICFFVAVSWAEILRLPHSFRLWGCWGHSKPSHFMILRRYVEDLG